MKYRVSIIIPVYKVEKYLCRCIDSIISQNREDLEIILVDDGSPDKCPAICDEYAKKYRNIFVIHKENGGLSSAIAAGTKIARGDYLAYIDSDDWMQPGWSDTIFNILYRYSDVDIIMYGLQRIEKGRVIYFEPFKKIRSGYYTGEECQLLKKRYMQPGGIGPNRWCKIYSKRVVSIVMKYYNTNISIGEDMNFSAIAIDVMKSAYIEKSTFVNYFINDGAMTQNFSEKYFFDYNNLFLSLNSYFKDAELVYYINYINMRSLVNAVAKSNYTNKAQYLKLIFDNKDVHERLLKINTRYINMANKIYRYLMLKSKTKALLGIAYCYLRLR